jgi:hypothetical protein
MYIQFATCERSSALRYLQRVYPNSVITDTPESAGPLLDLVEKDLVRVQDPAMYGNRIAIIPGNNFGESEESRAAVTRVCQAFVDSTKKSEAA